MGFSNPLCVKCFGRIILLALSMPVVSSCTVGPDFKRPDKPQADGYIEKAQAGPTYKALQLGKELPGQWWMLFRSKALTRLMEQAIKQNADLQSAYAVLVQAQENVLSKQGSFWPSLDAGGSAVRQRVAGAMFGNPDFPGSVFSLYNASVGISYTLDVFGGLRRQIENLEAQAEYHRFQLEAAFLTITANIITTAVEEASVRAQIAATEEMVKAQSEQLAVITRQFELGSSAKTAVLAQQTAVQQTKTTLPPLHQQLARVRSQLKVLAGDFPNASMDGEFQLDGLVLPGQIPLSLPSKLVEQRPDIRAQEAMLHAASAQMGVVIASVFPDFTLRANVSTIATEASGLFAPGSEVWNIAANIAQPIFQGGALLHQRDLAKAAYQQATAQYRGSVLQAFKEVADTLNALQNDADELASQEDAVQAALETKELTKLQFDMGAISYLDLLVADRVYHQARLGLIKAKAAQLKDTAGLFVALGGGWWQRPDLFKTLSDDQPKKQPAGSLLEQFEQFTTGQ